MPQSRQIPYHCAYFAKLRINSTQENYFTMHSVGIEHMESCVSLKQMYHSETNLKEKATVILTVA